MSRCGTYQTRCIIPRSDQSSGSETLAEESLGDGPEPIGAVRVEGVPRYCRSENLCVSGALVRGCRLGVVIEVPTSDVLQQRRDRGENGRRGSLLHVLPLVDRGGEGASHVPLQSGGDRARVDGVDEDPVPGPALSGADSEQDLGSLRLGISGQQVVAAEAIVD